jgi:hypothetical protein
MSGIDAHDERSFPMFGKVNSCCRRDARFAYATFAAEEKNPHNPSLKHAVGRVRRVLAYDDIFGRHRQGRVIGDLWGKERVLVNYLSATASVASAIKVDASLQGRFSVLISY